MIVLFGLAVAAYLYARQRRLAHLLPRRARWSTVPRAGPPVIAGPGFLSVAGHDRAARGTPQQPGTAAGHRHPWLHRGCRGRCQTARRLAQARDAAFLTAATAWVYVCGFAATGRAAVALLVLGSMVFGAIAQRDRPENDPRASDAPPPPRSDAPPPPRSDAPPPPRARATRASATNPSWSHT